MSEEPNPPASSPDAPLELVADSPRDGWAIVFAAPRHWLLRPPYSRENRWALTPLQVSRALSGEDFALRQVAFADWGSLVRHLARRRVEAATPLERQRAGSAALRILAQASVSAAEEHLVLVGRAIEMGRRSAAARVLHALLQSPAVQQEPNLVARVAALLTQAEPTLPKHPAPRGWTVRDEEAVVRRSKRISRGGSVLFPEFSPAAA